MRYQRILRSVCLPALFIGCGFAIDAHPLAAQNSSLIRRSFEEEDRAPLSMERASFLYVPPPPPPKQLSKRDHVRVRVDIKSRVMSEGEMQRRKTANLNAVLSDFPIIKGLRWIKPSPQSNGDPAANGQITQQFRALGELETSESLKQEIACEIVDIRPNGILVLEGHDSVIVNDEVWEFSISGECDPSKIDPTGVVLDRELVNKRISKRERGHVRDAYKRGWFVKWLDQFNPF
jgi:flagellar L-ring protein precursor FlgH